MRRSDGVNDSYQTRVVPKFSASHRQSLDDCKCRCTLLSVTPKITNLRSAWPTERKTLYYLLLHPEGEPTNGSPPTWNDTVTTVWKGNERRRTCRGRNGRWDDGKTQEWRSRLRRRSSPTICFVLGFFNMHHAGLIFVETNIIFG